ncbi:hypothetical protein MBCUR_11520 [Methanobrevibacter curvatus]|uniref:Uncharacterized protein n=1 Tax=Methanobrevibacter curvatus TaxID=49547 RepID=A0A166AK95_9EURY|nr:hypothetical protein MBCUR_11520 [Methanobrevibacter curvatus]
MVYEIVHDFEYSVQKLISNLEKKIKEEDFGV